MFYTKRPERVDAMRFVKPYKSVLEWMGEDDSRLLKYGNTVDGIRMPYGSNWANALVGDWILKTRGGGYLVVKDDDFRELFEPEIKPR